MVTVVFIGLVFAGVLVGSAAVAIFLRAAFAGAPVDEPDRPAVIAGDALRDWSARIAERFVAPRLPRVRSAAGIRDLSREMGERATAAMLPRARPAELERVVACGAGSPGGGSVTAVEAIAIAAELRANLPTAAQRRVLATARTNAMRLRAEPDATVVACPLRGTDGVCSVYTVRPLGCRASHAMAVAATMNGRAAPFDHPHDVVDGIRAGLARALQAAARDSHRYELNSALVAALEAADPAADWAAGKPVFAECLPE